MNTDSDQRAAVINSLIGKPYHEGGMGPDTFDCYGLARHLQKVLWDRELPVFQMPAEAGRFAIATAISAHPERSRWVVVEDPCDGAVVVMSRQECGFHMGVYVNLDGGLVIHTMEGIGVVADRPFDLENQGRWRLEYNMPVE